ncbi:MAG: carbon storage regulator CsrA [Clostridiales bacterium]|nr:carbon storage regulator CsrA [Clostridiales bacterium]
MLVITRKTGESIVIGDGIEITIADIQKGKVKIAIDAPRNVAIYRKEIIDEVRAANLDAGVRGRLESVEQTAEDLINRSNTGR